MAVRQTPQRKERYKGQYGIECLGASTEYEYNDNQDYLEDILYNLDLEQFDTAKIISIEVDENAILSILYPLAEIDGVICEVPK